VFQSEPGVIQTPSVRGKRITKKKVSRVRQKGEGIAERAGNKPQWTPMIHKKPINSKMSPPYRMTSFERESGDEEKKEGKDRERVADSVRVRAARDGRLHRRVCTRTHRENKVQRQEFDVA